MSKLMFRVYTRELKTSGKYTKWSLLASFLWKTDAIDYAASKHDPLSLEQIKIMHENRNTLVLG